MLGQLCLSLPSTFCKQLLELTASVLKFHVYDLPYSCNLFVSLCCKLTKCLLLLL